MEIVNYADVNVDDDNMEYIVKYEYEEGQEDKEIQEDQEDQEVPQYEEDQGDQKDEEGHLTLFDIDIGHNVINFYLQNFKKVVVYYPIPDYITNARKEFGTLTKEQRMEVLTFFMRQFAIEGIENIYEGINIECSLRTFLSRLMENVSRKFREKKMHKPDINLYLEVMQNLATIISNIAHKPRGGYRRKVKQSRKNKHRAKKTHKRKSFN